MSMRISEIHPAIVHYPIALLPTAFVADLLGAITGSRALSNAGRAMMPIGTISAAVAGVTGLMAQEAGRFDHKSHDVLVTHRNLNLGLIGAATALTVARLRTRRPGLGYLLASLASNVALIYSGYLGGKMVYLHGVGVEKANGVRYERSPEISDRRSLEQAARQSGRGIVEGARHAVRDLGRGEIAPALGNRGGQTSSAGASPLDSTRR